MLSLSALFDKRSGHVPRQAKLIRVGADPNEIEDYEKQACFFRGCGLDVSTRERLLNTLEFLQSQHTICVVYGALKEGTDAANMRRLKDDKRGKKDPTKIWKATIVDKPAWWLAIDIDKMDIPPEVHGLREQAEYARARLPAEFHDAWCVVTATGSYGIRGGARLRFWFWLDRPLTCAEKVRWLGKAPYIDRSIYTENQPIYTSGPVFEGYAEFDDPLFGMPRLTTLDGAEFVRTPCAERLKPPPRPSYRAPSFHIEAAGKDSSYGVSTLGSALYLIYRAPNRPERPRHEWIRIACHTVAQPIILGLLNAESALEQLIAASISIGKDEQETRNLFDWALRTEAARIALENGGSRHEEE